MTARVDQAEIADCVSRLQAVAAQLRVLRSRFEADRDGRAVFAYAYEIMTRRLAESLPGRDWEDPAWLVALDEEFASRFFVAVDAADRGADVPEGWSYVFQALERRRTSVLEDLVLGMVAHIVWDLPLALRDTTPGPEMAGRLADFHAVNRVLGEAIEEIQDAVSSRYDRLLGWLDFLGRGNDEILTNYGIRLSRGMAWYNAARLGDPILADAARQSLDRSPEIVARRILSPSFKPLRLGARLLRWASSFARKWPEVGAASGTTSPR